MLRVVVSSTSARRQTRRKRLAVSPSGQSPVASPQWLRALDQRPRQHPRPPDRGSSPHLDQLTRPMPYRLTNWSKTRCDSWDSVLPSHALFSALRMLADAKTMLAAEPVQSGAPATL